MFDYIKMAFIHAFTDATTTPFIEVLLVIYIIASLWGTSLLIMYLIYDAYSYHRNMTDDDYVPISKNIGTTGYNFDEPSCYIFIAVTLPFINLIGYPFIYYVLRIKK